MRSVHSLGAVTAAYFIVLLVAGCSGTKAVYEKADTPPQYAKAVLLHHNAIGSQVADLRADAAVSDASKAKLLEGYRLTVCNSAELAANESTATCNEGPSYVLEKAARAFEGAANAQTEAELQKAVDDLVGLLVTLIDTVNGAK